MNNLFELAALGGIDNEELEDAIIVQISQPRQKGYLRSTKYGRVNLNSFTDKEFLSNFRFKQEDITGLADALGLPQNIRLRNRYCATGVEGLSILLRRFAYPNRWNDLEPLFGLSPSYLSAISNFVMKVILEKKGHLLQLNTNPLLTEEKLQYYANAVADAGAPLKNCWGFIDGTARGICRPIVNQEEYYSGHKRMHCLKYLDILCPDGIIACIKGPYPGRRHDSGILRESGLYKEIERQSTFADKKFCVYGDSGFPIRELLLTPFPTTNLSNSESSFNTRMSTFRQAVEWGFGKVISEFAFLDFKKNQKLLHQEVGNMYLAAVILTNCHSCLYGNQTAAYFNTETPSLDEYLQ